MPIVDISIVPIGTGTTSVSRFVRAALEVIRKSGLEFTVGPMSTTVQGDWDQVLALIRQLHDTLVGMGCSRLVTTIKIDDRRDKAQTMQDKVNTVLGAANGNRRG